MPPRIDRFASVRAAVSFLLALSLYGAWAAPAARAQDRIALEAFDPAPMLPDSIVSVFGARALSPGGYTLTLLGAYGDKPLTLEDTSSDTELGTLSGSIGTIAFMGAFGIAPGLDLGFALPVHRVAEASSFGAGMPSAVRSMRVAGTELALGDLRFVPRYSVIGGDREDGLGLAVLAQVYLPTGKDAVYAGEPFRLEPRLALDWRNGRGLVLAFNVGYLIRAEAELLDTRVDDALRAGVGANFPIGAGVSGLVEVGTQLNVHSDDFKRSDAPTEGFLGLRYRSSGGWTAQLGGGPGLVRGLTAPTYRISAAVSFSREPSRPQSMPYESFPEPEPEPALDSDGDTLADARDQCPNEAEDLDGHRDDDGCPELDNDGDGTADANDSCPIEAEDRDGHQDGDGCPELDNDGDGVADSSDRCPLEVGVAADGGCPPAELPPAAKIAISERAIELRDSIYFATNSDVIEARSEPLLAEIAGQLEAHPEIEAVVVEGHSDDRGNAARNRQLSLRRATAVVNALVTRGVGPSRLRAEGFGPDRPLVPNDSEDNRAKNRRVELRIERRSPR
jgi:outer membrane protein OmpA-like peptidoglycan-associated protein